MRAAVVIVLVLGMFLSRAVLAQDSNVPSIRNIIPLFPKIFYPQGGPRTDSDDTANDENDRSRQTQEALVWEGLYPGPLDGEIGIKTISSIKRFQKLIYVPQDGSLSDGQFELLKQRALRKSQAVSFTTIVDQGTGNEIGLPIKLLSNRTASNFGPNFSATDGSIKVGLRAYQIRGSLNEVFEQVRNGFTDGKIDYAVNRSDWFVVSGELGPSKVYLRYHRRGAHLVGFFVIYNKEGLDFSAPLTMMSLTLRVVNDPQRAIPYDDSNGLLQEPLGMLRDRLSVATSGAYESVSTPKADSLIYWRYGQSILKLVSEGNLRTFYFERPSEEEALLGVRPGSLFFKGRRNGFQYEGVAFSYAKKCRPVEFSVTGVVSVDEEAVDLKGKRPIRARGGCAVSGFANSASDFTLSFVKQGLASAATTANTSPKTDAVAPTPVTAPIAGLSDDAAASKLLLESVQELLSKTNVNGVRFIKYTVDRSQLTGFREDMPVLRIVFPEQVFFDTDKSDLRSETMPILDSLVSTIKGKARGGPLSLFIAGHTDARGSDAHNLTLSFKRADSVARAIIAKDIGSAALWRVGFGRAVPIRPNDGPKNWALNRRVEFLLASQAPIIAAWIKSTTTLCEDKRADCGGVSVSTGFVAEPLGRPELKPVALEVPARPSIISDNPRALERPALPFNVPERSSIFEQQL